MDRFAAADLLREVCSERFGSVERAVAAGLALRYDGGPCFRSEHYQAEIDHLGIARSPAYHYEPETNGCVEKFIQTLKEQVLWIERFDSFEQLRQAVRDFARLYNHDWLLERHGYLTPIEARERLRTAQTGWPITPAPASGAVRSVLQARLVADQARLSVPTRVRAESRSRLPDCGG
jgi:transposase InsO family protein